MPTPKKRLFMTAYVAFVDDTLLDALESGNTTFYRSLNEATESGPSDLSCGDGDSFFIATLEVAVEPAEYECVSRAVLKTTMKSQD
jgi:hypothetical protein